MKRVSTPLSIRVRFGSMEDTISKQLKLQKVKFDPAQVKSFEATRCKILQLTFCDILTHSESQNAMKRLFAQILKHVKEQSK